MEIKKIALHHNEADQQFELPLENDMAIVAYRWLDDQTLALDHTEVPEHYEGQGVGSAIVEKVFQYLEENQLKMVPYCPFIRIYLQRHPDWERLRA
ncbi:MULTISPECIES: GNAT family N-acetyltransferase [unclassified Siphonobacter]|uniref:GNAT family N-acetyltransferase n=1 Tax=unclassified Siphonobacter TaxID=2635712 RepID=UPI000CA9F417|nr:MULTISPECIES: GNAT family N-acetyltransferase [unclassified Siphonobacter]MDQ1089338.1 putative GNAT family acetyltransferase [Siphonobacter sp. SORGH_AS_1065]MDR6195508.1 putative GNAT family acetyltransferase [Siphonobacter sp. SORGH_AS_0500]PKK34950.1 hypothetical protein BWI96_19730 [Siphonobacter sp. SORGH_AS_0500]